jgi:hypothetical protein
MEKKEDGRKREIPTMLGLGPDIAKPVSSSAAMDQSSGEVCFFAAHEINPITGAIQSEYPGYYNNGTIEEIDSELRYLEGFQSENGVIIDPGESAKNRARIKLLKKYQDNYREKISELGNKQDLISKRTKEVEQVLTEAMYSYDDDKRRMVDAHRQDTLETECKIAVSKEIAGYIVRNGGRVSKDGKTSLNALSRVWKIGRNALDEDSNTEIIRPISRKRRS